MEWCRCVVASAVFAGLLASCKTSGGPQGNGSSRIDGEAVAPSRDAADSDGEPHVLYPLVGANVSHIHVDADYLWWEHGDFVYQAPRGGSQTPTMIGIPSGGAANRFADDTAHGRSIVSVLERRAAIATPRFEFRAVRDEGTLTEAEAHREAARSYEGTSMTSKINLSDKFAAFNEHWRPKVIAALNGQEVKVVKVKGAFPWHAHEHEEEFFLVWKGEFTVEFTDRAVTLGPGECIVVPRGVQHRTRADDEAEVLCFEPAGVVNTGNVTDPEFTAPVGVSI
jgi:mannose-6-phosphate isomerase-like protein (cupin superfamily)